MKVKCIVCAHEIVVKDAVSGGVQMVSHCQTRHPKLAMTAVNTIAAYLSTFFFFPVVQNEAEAEIVPETGRTKVAEAYLETKKTLLSGFKLWAKTGIQ